MAKKSLREFDQDIESLGYPEIWIIVDKDNFVQAACWSTIYRDSHLRAHPDHVAMEYKKVEKK